MIPYCYGIIYNTASHTMNTQIHQSSCVVVCGDFTHTSLSYVWFEPSFEIYMWYVQTYDIDFNTPSYPKYVSTIDLYTIRCQNIQFKRLEYIEQLVRERCFGISYIWWCAVHVCGVCWYCQTDKLSRFFSLYLDFYD